MGSSQTRARNRVPCISRQILNHCATREAPNIYNFLRQFLRAEKLWGKYREFSFPLYLLFIINVSHQSGAFVTIDEPTLTHCNHLKFTLDVVHSMDLDRCRMTCIHHYGIIQRIFTTLKILGAPLIHPSHNPSLTFECLLNMPLCHLHHHLSSSDHLYLSSHHCKSPQRLMALSPMGLPFCNPSCLCGGQCDLSKTETWLCPSPT